MGNIKCLNCGSELTMISSATCPICGTRLSHVKISFLAYLGPADSLAGYQRSYKLVLLKSVFEEYREKGCAATYAVTERFRAYYQKRIRHGLLADKGVDNKIANAENSSLEDIFEVIKTHPLRAISGQGYLKLSGEGIKGIFELQRGLDEFSDKEIENLLALIDKKLDFYYKKIGSEALLDEPHSIDLNISPAERIRTQSGGDIFPKQGALECVIDGVNYSKIPVERLHLSNRAYNAIKRSGINTLAQLVEAIDTGKLRKIRNIGAGAVSEIEAALICSKSSIGQPLNQMGTSVEAGIAGAPIAKCFSENAFTLFRAYCKANHIQTLQDLDGFDFDQLNTIHGFGVAKIKDVKTRYTRLTTGVFDSSAMGEKPLEEKPFRDIHVSNLDLGVEILRFWKISSQMIRALKGQGFLSLRNIAECEESVLRKVVEKRKYPELESVLLEFFEPLNVLAEKILDSCAQNKSFDIFVRRAEGDSLQEIGNSYDVTRERIRQICNKFEQKIQPIILALIESIQKSNGCAFVTEEQVLSVFNNDSYDKVIVFVLKSCKEYDYIDFANVFVKKSSYPSAEEKLCLLAEEIVGDGINLFDKISEIENALNSSGYSFMTADSFIDLLIKCNYKFYGDIVVKTKKSYGLLGAEIVAEAFPCGIHFDDVDGPKLRAMLLQKYGELDLPESNRAFMTRVCNFLVQCGRSTYIAPQNINIDSSTLEAVKSFVDGSSQRDLYYTEIFSQFEGLLSMTSNVDNAAFLHGVLLRYYPNEYNYSRDYLSKSSGEESLTLSQRISKVLLRAGHALSKREIQSEVPGITEVMLLNAVTASNSLIQWEYGFYNDVGNLHLTPLHKDRLEHMLTELLSASNGYCSEKMLYQAAQEPMAEILETAKIENEQNLFYTISALLADKYEFRRPHIADLGRFSILSAKEIILDLLDYPVQLDVPAYQEVSARLLWPDVTIGMVFTEIEKDYIRIGKDQYLRADAFSLSPADTEFVVQQIAWAASDAWYLPLMVFSGSEEYLPNGLEVNEFLIAATVAQADVGWYSVYPQAKDRRYQKGILVRNEVGSLKYDALVARALTEAGFSELSEAQLLAFLQIHQFAYKSIPKELWNAEHLWYENNMFHVKP